MPYEKHTWLRGETITAENLNHLEDGIVGEQTTRASQDQFINDRIDQIIAPTGEAPSPEEITDARIGEDGTVYNTLGTAIRTQVGDLKNALTDITENGYYTFTQKKAINTDNPSGLALQTDADTDCLLIECNAGDVFTVRGEGWSRFALWAFFGAISGSTYPRLAVSGANTKSDFTVITAPEDAKYLVVNVKRVPQTYSGFCCSGAVLNKRVAKSETDIQESQVVFTPTLELHNGYIDGDGDFVHNDSNASVYSQKLYYLSKVDVEIIFGQQESIWFAVAEYSENGAFIRRQTESNNSYIGKYSFDVSEDAAYVILSYRTFGKSYTLNLKCTPKVYDSIKATRQILFGNFNTTYHSGYINGDGEYLPASANEEVYTDRIYNVSTLGILMSFASSKDIWVAAASYDKNDKFLSRTILINRTTTVASAKYTVPANTYYTVIMFRTFGTTYTINIDPVYNINPFAKNIVQNAVTSKKAESFVGKTNSGSLKIINHRGYNTVAPENTLPAFALSAQEGYKYVECDIRFTSDPDSVPVILHDSTINRTARNEDGTEISETININDISYDDLLNYDFGIWKGQEYAGTKIPTFEQFVVLCKRLGLKAYVEVKATATSSQAETVVSIIKKYNMMNDITLIAFSVTDIKALTDAGATCDVGLLVSSNTLSSTQTGFFKQYKENRRCFADVTKDNISQTLISQANDLGIDIEAWVINSVTDLNNVYDGIAGITTDDLKLSEVIESYLPQ